MGLEGISKSPSFSAMFCMGESNLEKIHLLSSDFQKTSWIYK